jgi:hypothetical protein
VNRATKRLLVMAIALATAAPAVAQDTQKPAAQPSRPAASAPVYLKLSLVVSRYQGDKKISSIPHTILVSTDSTRTSLRLGTQVPVPSTVLGEKGATPSYSYRDVGTNIDCTATSPMDGFYRLAVTISDSSVYYPDQAEPVARSITASTGAPAFRAFNTSFTFILHDGQTAPTTSVTDPISGQVIKVDATINVQK